MTDLHCHILPGIDDGAKDTAVSLELLRREYEDGVRNIAFTSHFNSERTTVEAFTAKRQAAFEQLTAALEGQPMQFDFKLGAEVFFSPGLCELDTRALCMGDTAYLLLEFPTTHKPHFIRQTLYNLQQQGIVPLIAHIERYPYVLEDPTLLYDWVAAGAYAQINAGALLEPKLQKAVQVHPVGTGPRHLHRYPFPGQAPAPHGTGSAAARKAAGQGNCRPHRAQRR